MKKIILLITLLIGIISCAPQNKEAFLTQRSAASSSGLPSRWPASSFPINLQISSDFSNDEIDAIKDMANQWSLSTNNQISFFETTQETNEKAYANINSYNDNQTAVYKLSEWPSEFPASALAVTQVFGTKVNSGAYNQYIKIEHADIMINYDNFEFSTNYGFGYDLQTVILHEMGHFLGLYHDNSSPDESIMYPSISRFRDNRLPKDKDSYNIEILYSLNRNVASVNNFLTSSYYNSEVLGEKVVLIYEIYPNGKEKKYIKSLIPVGRENK